SSMPDDRGLAEAQSQWRNRLNTFPIRSVVNERDRPYHNQDELRDTNARPSRSHLYKRTRLGDHSLYNEWEEKERRRLKSPHRRNEKENNDDSSDGSDGSRSSDLKANDNTDCVSDSSVDTTESSDSEDSSENETSSEDSADVSTDSDDESSEESSDESTDEDRSCSDEEEEEVVNDRSFASGSDDTSAPSLLTESDYSGDERFGDMLMRRLNDSTDGSECTTDADTSEDEYSEEEEGYTTEEDETSEGEDEEIDEDDVTDEESEEDIGRVDEAMIDDEDSSSPSSSPPSSYLADLQPPLPIRRPPTRHVGYRNPHHPNESRRLGAVVARAERHETSSSSEEESEYSDEEDSDIPEDPQEVDRRGRPVRRIEVEISSEEEEDSDEEVSDESGSGDDSSEEEMSEHEREQRKAEDKQRVTSASTALLGACTICHEDDVVEPTMCKNCKNIIGCYTCVARWMRAAEHPQCPLCRERWTEDADRAIAVRLLY
ncbi:hypothetical protein PENTCL1PPCAC_25288, partial [Pristionchus entomophagus]